MSENSELPLVSVVIPTKNRPDLLRRAVESVISQTYPHIEIVIVDDGSIPAVAINTIASLSKGRAIRLVRNEVSKGGGKSRNIGSSVANGEFVCFLDDDDIYYSNKISILHSALRGNPKFGVAFGKVSLNDGTVSRQPIKYPVRFNPDLNFALGNYIHTSATLMRKEVLDNVSFHEPLTRYQDTQFHLELTLKCNIIFVDECVSEWNVDGREDQITSNATLEKKINSYKAFEILRNYFVYDLGLKGERTYFFDYYLQILRFKAKEKGMYRSLLKSLLSPINLSRMLLVMFKRKKYFRV
jgi:glycosyltransferase involved in cell wall biosynthesis